MGTRKHRLVTPRMLLVSIVVGVLLAVASVPVAAMAVLVTRPNWQSYPPPTHWEGGIQREDHVEFIAMHQGLLESYWETRQIPEPVDPKLRSLLPRWVEPRQDPRPGYARWRYPGIDVGVHVYAYGWPTRGAYGRMSYAAAPSGAFGHSYDGLVETRMKSNLVRFPLRPIWPGLLANTLFYATIILALLVGLRLTRIRRRRKRGRCIACAYELGQSISVCPECGLAARL
ncbi:MAG: hypothetical protein RIB58_07660 [Phycisphaerales bacterium]